MMAILSIDTLCVKLLQEKNKAWNAFILNRMATERPRPNKGKIGA